MSRKRASVRREEILAATVEEIEESGLRTLRVADVSKRLGLSPSLVIYHFVTKEALVAAAFAHAGENDLYRARRTAASGKPPSTRLIEVIRWYMPTGSTRSWKIWIDGWSAGMFDDQLKATFAALDEEWKTILGWLIVSGWETGEIAGKTTEPNDESDFVAAKACATRILAYMDGLAIQNMLNSSTVDQETMTGWIDRFVVAELGFGLEK